MNIEAKKAYLIAIKDRYKKSSKKEKTQILNEFCLNTSYSRKHAIKLLGQKPKPCNVLSFKKKVGTPKIYSKASEKRLIELWQLMNYMASVHLKEALKHWLPYDLETSDDIKEQLLQMSPSTIERVLKPTKQKRPEAKSTTTPPKVKSQIPLKLCKDNDKKAVGHFEADTVAHCGNRLEGQFAWTLTMTDLHSGWTENRSCDSKRAEDIKSGVKSIEKNLPFAFVSFSSDNGSEFLNETMHDYLIYSRGNEALEVTRGRPYKKNDNAHVEQKNNTHVRGLFGYERIEGEDLVELMNDIYMNYWCPLKNYYTPCMKLVEKTRVGAKIKKKYDKPKTPYERLLESGQLSMREMENLKAIKSDLNPFKLTKEMNEKLKIFYRKLERCRLAEKLVA